MKDVDRFGTVQSVIYLGLRAARQMDLCMAGGRSFYAEPGTGEPQLTMKYPAFLKNYFRAVN